MSTTVPPISLRESYAMSGTAVAYGAISLRASYAMSGCLAIFLRVSYAVPGTDIACVAITLCDMRYWRYRYLSASSLHSP
eukprot:3205386-Rhodomonas_salina.1